MPREQEERTEQTLVTSLLSLVSTLTGLWSSWSFPEPPLATCSKRTACKACPKEKERSPFLKMMMFLLNTGAKPSLFSSREEILGIFMKLHYDCQVVLACKPSFYIGMTKHYSTATPLLPNGYANFPRLFLNQLPFGNNSEPSLSIETAARGSIWRPWTVRSLPFLVPPAGFYSKGCLRKKLSQRVFLPKPYSPRNTELNTRSSCEER